MEELTQDEIIYYKKEKQIADFESQIAVLSEEKESLLIEKDIEKQAIIDDKETAIQNIQKEIDLLK